ncbi:hypothetical protein REPUB_Repub20aG0098300 [Reevesia pubescens]
MAKWPNSRSTFEDIFKDPNLISVSCPLKSPSCAIVWAPPPVGVLKFNVDWSSLDNPGAAGISGVIHNSLGERLLIFSKPIGKADSIFAEFMAIFEAFKIFVSSKWVSSFVLVIESDCSNAVKWFNNNHLFPWRLKRFCPLIDSFKNSVLDWKIQHVVREANDVADAFAKEGACRTSDLLVLFA